MIKRATYSIDGIVQGVSFRYFIYRHATELGLKGYARNLWDGTVEVIAEGQSELLDELHGHLKMGPSHANVHSCDVIYSDATGEFSDFSVM